MCAPRVTRHTSKRYYQQTISESSEHQMLWFHVISRLVIIGILTTNFNKDFNNRR
jgi:hypothetical protein